MTLYYVRQVDRQTDGQIDRYIDGCQRMYENIINYNTRRHNIVVDVIMNLHYSFVIIKCNSYCKTKA